MQAIILIVADAFDVHADNVEAALRRRGQAVFRLNLDKDSLAVTNLSIRDGLAKLRTPKGVVTSQEIGAVWARRAFIELSLEERDSETVDERIWRNEWNRSLVGLYHALLDHPWLSPLSQAIKAENKFLQYGLAKDFGLKMPRTLTSNIRSELVEFCEECGGNVAFKLMHQDIYRQGDQVVGLFTNRISSTDLEKFALSNENPITIQEYIDKAFEVRYTVVGDQHFVCRIESQASPSTIVDWRRYDIPNTPHIAMDPPIYIRQRVSQLLEALGIRYGALDFIVTPHGEWYFLEINPMGQWLWIEDLTNLPITNAIADVLCQLNQQTALEGCIE